MSGTTISQRSFSGGEITPALYGRVDQVKYATGLRTCRNMIVMRHGGVTNRSGTEFVCEVEDSADVARLTEFVFNNDQTYILLWGDLTLRIIKDGVLQREAAKTITDITDADPAVVTSTAHGYSDGDEVYITDVLGMTEVNQRSFLVSNKTANTFELQTKDGVDLDASAFTSYSSAGSSEKAFQLTTPYLKADLDELHFVQSADVVTLCHPTYEPRELTRTSDITWSLDVITFLPSTAFPTTLSGSTGVAGSETIKYKVTAVDPVTGEESLPAITSSKTITGITKANPAVVSSTAHGYEDGDVVLIRAVVGMTEVNNRRFTVANKNTNDFELLDEDSSSYTTYSSAGTSNAEYFGVTSASILPTKASPHVLTWDAVTDVRTYNIYRQNSNNVYGFIGFAGTNTFNDVGEIVFNQEDETDTPPADRNPFLFTGNYPSTVTFHQQRRVFANTDNNVEKVWTSRSGDFSNFATRKPIQDDDPVTFNIAGLKVNEVHSMTTVNGELVLMSEAGEWAIQGGVSGVLTPSDINPAQFTFNGSGKLQPLLINDTAIYLQGRQNRIRAFSSEGDFTKFSGSDLTIFSDHLFENKTITDMTFQQIPHSVAYFVRSDGTLLGMTMLKEQEILAWHRHDFENGLVESVASVPEGTSDAVYVIVKRTIDVQGTEKTVRYVERLKPRVVADVEDYSFMDSSIKIDGTNSTATTMTLTTGTGWLYTDDLTLTSSVSHFSSGDVGNLEIHMTDSLGDIIRLEITAYTSGTVVTVRPHKTVPATMQATALTTWGDAVGVVKGLWHLEGRQISAYADGFVKASVYNESYAAVTVSGGEAILDRKHVVLQAGEPITSDIETLNIDSAQTESLADRKMNSSRVVATVESTRGLWAGTEVPTGNTTGNLVEFKLRNNESQELPTALATENIDVNVSSSFTEGGRVFIRQVDPVPCSILSIHASGYFPFRG